MIYTSADYNIVSLNQTNSVDVYILPITPHRSL